MSVNLNFSAPLVRPNAWWNNKIPLTFLMLLLLVNQQMLSDVVVPLIGVILIVCSVANFGYAINDLYDQDEDRRSGKANAATTIGERLVWRGAAASAGIAGVLSLPLAGLAGVGLVSAVLLLPLIYSVPPLRVKERHWLGVFADALAAHVFPALLALLVVTHQQILTISPLLITTIVVWALATGLRGILTHQLKSEVSDKGAGLLTVAHQIGNGTLTRLIVFFLTPIEAVTFSLVILLSPLTFFGLALVGIYLVLEVLKTSQNMIKLKILNHKGHRYIPFIDECGYKVWGPLVLALDASIVDPAYLLVALLYFVLFKPAVKREWRNTLLTVERLCEQLYQAWRRNRARSDTQISRSGVITLCDENYFPGLLMLHRSVQESGGYPIACYDIGLTDNQRAEAALRRNLHILQLPDDPLIAAIQTELLNDEKVKKQGKRVWPLWICPLLIKHAPFEKVLWLDCDLVVLRDLDSLFEKLEKQPVFTPENFAPEATSNKPSLYDHLPISRQFNRNVPAINAGVSGWCKLRDRDLIEAYVHPVSSAVADPKVRALISWQDQGALIWAIQSKGMERYVETDNCWNQSASLTSLKKAPLKWDEKFLPALRNQHPDVKIMHWNGLPLPWAHTENEMLPSSALPEEIADYYDAWTDRYRDSFEDTFQAARPAEREDLNQYLMERSGLRNGDHVLDAGCGVCGPSMHFASNLNLTIDALTVSGYQVAEAQRAIHKAGLNHNIHVKQGDFHSLPEIFPAGRFDRALFFESFSHAHDPMRVLQGAYEILKPGGTLYIKDFFIKEHASRDDQERAQEVIKKVDETFVLRTPCLRETEKMLEKIGFKKQWVEPIQFQLDSQVWMRFNIQHRFDLYSGKPPIEWCDWLELRYTKPAQ